MPQKEEKNILKEQFFLVLSKTKLKSSFSFY